MGKDFEDLIGRCRCRNHAETFKPRSQNQSRTYYFLLEEHTPTEFICGACIQSKDTLVHGGLVIIEESSKRGSQYFNHLRPIDYQNSK